MTIQGSICKDLGDLITRGGSVLKRNLGDSTDGLRSDNVQPVNFGLVAQRKSRFLIKTRSGYHNPPRPLKLKKMEDKLYSYGIMVFNGEKEKFESWLDKNKTLTETELKQELDKLEYGIFN